MSHKSREVTQKITSQFFSMSTWIKRGGIFSLSLSPHQKTKREIQRETLPNIVIRKMP